MRILTFLGVSLIFIASAFSDVPVKYSRIRLNVPDKAALDKVWAAGIDFEGSSGKVGYAMEFIASFALLVRLYTCSPGRRPAVRSEIEARGL